METSCRILAGRMFQNVGPETFIVDFLVFVHIFGCNNICILVSEFMTVYIISS